MSISLGIGIKIGGNFNSLDSDALSYLKAEGITDFVITNAINELVVSLKAINNIEAGFVNFTDLTLSKSKAIYPFPGTGGTNDRNLLSPADTDASFRLHFSSAPTISDKGINFGGNKYADTHLNPSVVMEFLQNEMDVYLTSYEKATATGNIPNEEGVYLVGGQGYRLLVATGHASVPDNFWCGTPQFHIGALLMSASGAYVYNTIGFWQVLKSDNTTGNAKIIRNGRDVLLSTSDATGSLPDGNFYIGAANASTKGYSNRTFGWARIGDNISEAANTLYINAVEKYQYNLGRLPLKNLIFTGHSFYGSALDDVTYYDIPSYTNYVLLSAGKDIYTHRNFSGGGVTVAILVAGQATINSYLKDTSVIPFKNIMILYVGINDLTTNRNGTTSYNDMKAFINTQTGLGMTVFAFTITPSTSAGCIGWDFSDQRNIFNNLMRTDLASTANCYVIDTDLIDETADPDDTDYYVDKLHPTAALKVLLGNAAAAKFNEVYI